MRCKDFLLVLYKSAASQYYYSSDFYTENVIRPWIQTV